MFIPKILEDEINIWIWKSDIIFKQELLETFIISLVSISVTASVFKLKYEKKFGNKVIHEITNKEHLTLQQFLRIKVGEIFSDVGITL